MKKLIALLIAAMMIISMIPVMAISSSAEAGEQAPAATGDWDVYRLATEYPTDKDKEDPDKTYKPTAGYDYTDDGFSVIAPDYMDDTPSMTVQTTYKVNLKEGFFVKFRIDDYSYDGGTGADQWIAPSFTTEKMVAPGNTNYGGGWLTLIRGAGDGNYSALPHMTLPTTETSAGSFIPPNDILNAQKEDYSPAEMDEDGREIYTLEVTWNGSAYEFKLNGGIIPHADTATTVLNRLDANGEFYFGISMMATVKGGTAELTILECGTSAATATKPTGSDSREPEENMNTPIADIADASTVETNMPAILWSPETVNMTSGTNIAFTVQGDNTWNATATSDLAFWQFNPKRAWSYAGEDFPVFGILLKNFKLESGTVWYAAGDVVSAKDSCTTDFSVWYGETFGADEEYVFVPIDMTDLWEGRINSVRLDFAFPEDEEIRTFDICFAGMFRSEDEAYAYAQNWLAANTEVDTGIAEKETTPEAAPETEANTNAGVDATTDAATEDAGNDNANGGLGCASVVGMGAVAILAAAAAAVALKKKD